jgi:hypothetical protein
MGIDSGHWYKRDGSPCYEIAKKDGGVRGVNLRWDRHLGLVPSVTTVLQVVAKPQLETWKVKQGILAALTLPRGTDEDDESYLGRVLSDSREQAKQAAEEGTRIHDAIESSFKTGKVPGAYAKHVEAVRMLLKRVFPEVTDWIAEASFAHTEGFGGKVDLHSPSTGIVVDYKGKDGDFSDGKKLAYDQHWQLAAYRMGLWLPRNIGCNIFVSRTHPGAVAHHIWSEADMDEGEQVFRDALRLWKRLKKYDGSFCLEDAA